MRILALETANEHCSVALVDDGEVCYFQQDTRSKMQTQVILPMIEQGLQQLNWQCSDLTAIAFSRGPGSFSGVRINATVAQALAWVNDLPVISISTLQALAQHAHRTLGLTQVTAVIDARMNEVYLGNFSLNEQHIMQVDAQGECLVNYDDAKGLAQFPCVGSGASLIAEDVHILHVDAQDIAELAQRIDPSQWLSAEHALPVYLRNDAWKKISEQGKPE